MGPDLRGWGGCGAGSPHSWGCQWPSGGARLSLHPGSSQRDPIPFPFSAGWSVGDPPPPPPPLPALTPHPRTPRLAPRPPGTMAQVGHRVDYLAGFCCPVGGLVAGKPRVLCHENEIYLSNGSEFVYVYDQEGKVLKVSGLVGLGGRGGFTPSPLCWDGALGLGAGVLGQGEGGGDASHVPCHRSPSLGLGSLHWCPLHPQTNFTSRPRAPYLAPRPLLGVGGAAVWPLS